MMRRLSYCLLFLLLLAACSPEREPSQQWDGPFIEFNLDLEEDFQTKAGNDEVYEQAGDNVFHENDINWVDFYFYPKGATASQATYHTRKELTSLTRNNATFRLELTPNQVNYQIFPVNSNTEEAEVFVLVNVSKTLLDWQDDLSMPALKALLVTTDFEAETHPENHRQPSFMMSGEGLVKLKPNGRTQKEVAEPVTINLQRYACKLTVSVKAEDNVRFPRQDGVDVYDEIWKPSIQEMKIYIVDAVKTVSLGGEPRKATDDNEVLSYRENPLLFFENLNTGTTAEPEYILLFDQSPGGYYNTYPTYMYPQKWENGKEGEPYLKLVLPWVRQADSEHGVNELKKEFYYKILIPKDRRGGAFVNTFTRNNWYHYNIDVGMLGADTDDASVQLNPIECYVYYWQDKNVVVKHADIGNARYLHVNQKEYVLHNEPELAVHFTTSHPVSYQVNSATRPYYGQKSPGETAHGATIHMAGDGSDPFADGIYTAGTYYLSYDEATTAGWFEQVGGTLHMTHPLENNYTSANFDYSPYTFSLTIYHKDKGAGSDYSQDFTILQHPAIYIESEQNSDPRVAPEGQDEPYPDEEENAPYAVWQNYRHNGFVFIDGQRIWRHKTGRSDDGEYGVNAKKLKSNWSGSRTSGVSERLEWLQWRTVNFTGGNRNNYTIHVSVLPDDKYIIGDPRTLTPETWNNGAESSSPAVANSKYYYWYDSDGDGTRDTEDQEYSTHFHSAPDLRTGEVRPLTHYYPAEESSRTANMLAPALRVSSRFGGVEFYGGFTRRSARFKCATYQEDGYPAGRWRLPTKAEIDFIGTLTIKGGFVKLFSNTGKYWSAHGAVQPNAGVQNVEYALVRCVYDAWYWDPYDDRLPEGQDGNGDFYRDHYFYGDFER